LLDVFIKCETTTAVLQISFPGLVTYIHAIEPRTFHEPVYAMLGDVFEALKFHLDRTIVSFTPGLVSQTTSETQKLGKAAEAGKLKLEGYNINARFFGITHNKGKGTLNELGSLQRRGRS